MLITGKELVGHETSMVSLKNYILGIIPVLLILLISKKTISAVRLDGVST